jgi:SHS2 domain-containing protein
MRIMTGELDAGARRALMEVNKEVADQQRREGTVAKMDMRNHPFDWWDLLLFVMPIASIVFVMFSEAE